MFQTNMTAMKHGYLDTYPIRDTGIPRYIDFSKTKIRGYVCIYIYIKYKKILNVMIFHKIKKQQLKEF
jgi:hypothetical protein